MRYYRALNKINETPAGSIIELSDDDAAPLVECGAIEPARQDHLVERFEAAGAIDPALEKALRAAQTATDRARKEIGEIGGRIAQLEDERAQMLSGSLSKGDAIALVRRDIERRGEGFRQRMMGDFFRVRGSRGSSFSWNIAEKLKADERGWLGIPYFETPLPNMPPSQDALCFYFGDIIAARTLAMLDELEWDAEAPSIAVVKERVETIEREIAELHAKRTTLVAQINEIAVLETA